MPAAHDLATLTDRDLVLRPSTADDARLLLPLLAQPEVTAWWGHNTLDSIADEIIGAWTIEIGAEVAGILECHEESEPMYPGVAFDIMLGTQWHGRSYGRRALRLAIDYFLARGHHRFTIDPAVANEAAVRCYSAVGFRPVGILRQAERSPSTGAFRDALLMDLLASDLADETASP